MLESYQGIHVLHVLVNANNWSNMKVYHNFEYRIMNRNGMLYKLNPLFLIVFIIINFKNI